MQDTPAPAQNAPLPPLASLLFVQSEDEKVPQIQPYTMNDWLQLRGYDPHEYEPMMAGHGTITSVLAEGQPLFGLRLELEGGERDGPIDLFFIRAGGALAPKVLDVLLDTVAKQLRVASEEGEDPEIVKELRAREQAFLAYTCSRQRKENTLFYGFVSYEEIEQSKIIGAPKRRPQQVDVAVGALAFKQSAHRLTMEEAQEMTTKQAADTLRDRGGRIFRFDAPAGIKQYVAQVAVQATLESEMSNYDPNEEQEERTQAGLVVPSESDRKRFG